MIINYLGGGSFKLQSGETSLLIDPDGNRFKADVILRTLFTVGEKEEGESHANISFPGEYEVKEIEVTGVPVKEESGEKFLKTIYLVRWDGIKFAFLGHLSKYPSAEIIESVDEPDVVFVPVGGGHFLSAEEAAKLTKKLKPSVVIPMFYKAPKDFFDAMGQKSQPEEKFVFKKKDLEVGKTRVVVLKA